jgi:DNA-binding FadR family transcriptional regulator
VAGRYASLILEYRGATLDDVYKAAAFIEPICVRHLARHHTSEDLALLRDLLEQEESAKSDPNAQTQCQERFHDLLVELTGNQTLTLFGSMMRYIVGRADRAVVSSDPDVEHRKKLGAKVHRVHRKLVKLIESGDADAAEALWLGHLAAADHSVRSEIAGNVLDIID